MKIFAEALGRLLAFCCLPPLRLFIGSEGQANQQYDVWLIGENQGESLEDNGHAFYRYCRNFHPEKSVYFILKTSSPFYRSEFYEDHHVIKYGSIRHMLYFSKANIFFYCHTYRDLMYRRFFEIFSGSKKLVYLHHGTLGFKKFDPFYYCNRNIMEIFTAGSAMERDILVNLAGVDEYRVKLTGFARSDSLAQNRRETARQLLYMPTHRRHLVGEQKIEFIRNVLGLVRHPGLVDLLEAHDLTLKIYLHAHSQKTLPFQGVDHPRIQMVKLGTESVRDLLCTSMLMITDYSSVCWDFLTLGKPVIFYRFDIDNYAAKRDSYIDLRDDSYGEIAYDEGRLLELLSQYLDGGCVLKASVEDSIGAVVSEDGRSNCDRIFALSEELGSAGYPS